MKLKVLKEFRDKFDGVTIYKAGTTVEFDDEVRCQNLVERGLCEVVKGPSKKTAEAPQKAEAPAEETSEVPAEEPEKAEAPAEETSEVPAEEPEKVEAPAEPEKPAKSATSKKAKK